MAAFALLTLALAALAAFVTHSWSGALYLLVYLAAVLPGLPIGRRLFGRHPLALPAGAVMGYGLSCLTAWAVVKSGLATPAAFVAAWAIVGAGAAIACRGRAPLVALPAWERRDTILLLCILAIVAALMALPYRHIGMADEEGNRLYRAYFTADFWWHMALTAELARFDLPPVNPYLAPERMHYYWTYFLVPAATVRVGPSALANPELVLKVNALCTALLFTAAVFALAWCAVRRTWPLAAALSLALFAPSAEGLYAAWQTLARGRSLDALRYLNIDAVSAWTFNGLRIDSLLRNMWYNPQHSTSAALALVALVVVSASGSGAPVGAIVVAGLALGLSTTFNPFVGGVFSLVYGLVVAADAARTPRDMPRRLLRHALAAIPPVAALGWCIGNQMVEGAGGVLRFDTAGPAWNAPVASLLVSLGPALLPAVLGLWPLRGLGRPYWASAAGVTAGLVLMYLLWLSVDRYWVGFRTGQIVLCAAPALIGRFFEQTTARAAGRWLSIGAFALLALAGLPTTVVDAFNAQDDGNRAMGPGFRWTIPVSPDQQAAMDWIRKATPPEAVVQLEPVGRGRDTWSLVASLGERRMAAGVPLPLIETPEYRRRMKVVREIYATTDAAAGWRDAHALGIDYLYVDDTERARYGDAAVEKFAASPEYFVPAFRKGEVAVYAVAR